MATSSIQIPGYELLRPLGSGGMSTVYLALQRSLDRKVAIKIMRRTGDSASADAVQGERRFLLEGRMMAKLPHRNIVAVYDIVSNDTMAYISMEYLDGGTLSDRMKSGLALADAVSVIVQIASALEFSHTHGVIHRDLKPANIMFRGNGTPVLTDFGIARYQDGSATRLTQTGMLVGTPTYMSPEQINGGAVDGRADLYSLGILFYELLTGQPPFRGDTPIAVLMAHLTQPPPPLPEEFRSFQDVMDRMLAKNRDERYTGMKEFGQDLKARLVHSDTLMTRLQLDPDQTSSEQLRALGFSNSSPTGEGLRDSLLSRLPTNTQRNAAPKLGAVSTRPPVPVWMWLTAAAGAVLIAIGAWMSLHGRGGLSKDDQIVVGLFLEKADQYAGNGNLLTPPDENAFAYVQKALQRDPENPKAQALIDRIGSTLAEQAQNAFAAKKLNDAADFNNQALLVRPDDAASRTLKEQIAQANKTAQNREQVRGLLERAEAARVAGRAFGENSAYTLLVQAHALASNDAEVQKRIDALVSQQLEIPRKTLTEGQAVTAAEQLAKLQPYLGSEPAFAALRSEIDAASKKQQAEKDISSRLARGNEELRAGHLDEPGGDNAYETFGELGKLAASDPRVVEFGNSIARALLADARKLDTSGQSARALGRVGLALNVAPTLADAQSLKTQIEQRLGAREAKIVQTLNAAKQATAEQRFVPPAADDANTALVAVLALDPNNAEAKQLLADLPKRISEAAITRAQNDAGAATAMINAARQVFPQDAALAALSTKLQTQLVAEKAAAQAQLVRERVAKVIAAPTPTPDQLRAAGKDISDLLAANAADKDTLALRTQLIDEIGANLQAASSVVQFDALGNLLKEQEKLFGTDHAYAALTGTLPALRAKVAQAEQARAEAQLGTLVLNAYPWGKVESVLDANSQPVSLPNDANTPLTLNLPAGSYRITFRHPQAAKPTQVIAKVEAQKRAVANATFATISTQEYFSRAGW